MPPGSESKSSFSRDSRWRREIFVDSEISSRVTPRISRSRRNFSPNAPMATLLPSIPVKSAHHRKAGPLVSNRKTGNYRGNKDFCGYFRVITQRFPLIRGLLIWGNRVIIRARVGLFDRAEHKDLIFPHERGGGTGT